LSRISLSSLVIATCLCCPFRALAQAEPSAGASEPGALRDQARAAFDQAAADFEAGRYRAALQGFEQAARWLPSAELWFNVGRAREELGELEGAVEAFRRYVRDSVDAPDRAAVEARIERLLEARAAQSAGLARSRPVALLRIEAEPVGARVSLDGAGVGEAPLERWLSLDPGEHALRVAYAGHVPAVSRLELESGTVTVAQTRLVKERPEPVPAATRRLWTWIAFGMAGAGLASGAGLAIAGADPDSHDSIDVARDAALAAGLGFAMLGALLYVLEGEHEARDVAAR
jgi:tetratricopeptide (TPR) repeat protein